jgi:hypothetical protein
MKVPIAARYDVVTGKTTFTYAEAGTNLIADYFAHLYSKAHPGVELEKRLVGRE